MKEQTIQVQNITGIHARPAARFVKLAAQFPCEVFLRKHSLTVNGKSILGVMSLAAEKGSTLIVRTDGEKEQEALEKLVDLLNQIFIDEKNIEENRNE